MTFELVAVIGIGTAFLLGVLVLIEHDRWAGSAVRPIGEVPGSGLLGRLADRIRESVLAWLIGGAVARIRTIMGRERDDTEPPERAATRPAPSSSGVARPVPVRPTRIVVAGERRPMLVPSSSSFSPPIDVDSPRRRLWRDASSVLAVIAVAAIAVTLGSQQSTGGVLSATATPPAASGPSGGHVSPGTRAPAGQSASADATNPMLATADAVPTPDASAAAHATPVPSGPPAVSGGPSASDRTPPAALPPGPAPTRAGPAPTPPPPGARPTRVPVAAIPTVRPAPPVARFGATPVSGPAPLTVSFADRSTGGITSWAWDFGDGSTSSSRDPAHTFDTPGFYGVTLTVTGAAGSDSYALTIHVEGPTPTP